MSTTMPRHSARPARERRVPPTWIWAVVLVVLLCTTGYLWSHVVSGS